MKIQYFLIPLFVLLTVRTMAQRTVHFSDVTVRLPEKALCQYKYFDRFPGQNGSVEANCSNYYLFENDTFYYYEFAVNTDQSDSLLNSHKLAVKDIGFNTARIEQNVTWNATNGEYEYSLKLYTQSYKELIVSNIHYKRMKTTEPYQVAMMEIKCCSKEQAEKLLEEIQKHKK